MNVIEVDNEEIVIRQLTLRSRDVAHWLEPLDEGQRPHAIHRAIEVGFYCLERASNAKDTEFVRRQLERMLEAVEREVSAIPNKIQAALLRKVGTAEGQVLEPVTKLVELTSNSLTGRVQEIQQLFSQEIDPTKTGSTLGKALSNVRDLLDPNRTDSIQGSIRQSLDQLGSHDGTLARTVRQVLQESLKPIADRVDAIAQGIATDKAVLEVVETSTLKGASYEMSILDRVVEWAQVHGSATVEHIGKDNKPGDVVIHLASLIEADHSRLVIEARDRASAAGHKVIRDTMCAAMKERSAGLGIYISKTADGFSREIGEWSESVCEQGPIIACTNEHLTTAIRFLVAQERLNSLKQSRPEISAETVAAQVKRMRTALRNIKNINSAASSIRKGADGIQTEAETLRDEIRDALTAIEDALKEKSISESSSAAA